MSSMPTQPDQIVGHLEGRPGGREVGHRAGLLDQRLDRAQGLGQGEDPCPR